MQPHQRHNDFSDTLLPSLSSLSMSDASESIDVDPQSHPAVSLNVDIMHIIMSYAHRSVVSRLMKTCNTLNSEGARYLFKDEVSFRYDAELVSFFWFLKARDNSSERCRRITFLNRLSLDFKDPTENISQTLERSSRSSSGLEPSRTSLPSRFPRPKLCLPRILPSSLLSRSSRHSRL